MKFDGKHFVEQSQVSLLITPDIFNALEVMLPIWDVRNKEESKVMTSMCLIDWTQSVFIIK